ncbi:hypothetical protein SAMN05421823_108166 [Catalinimonas alkaloidigena]|uniref:Uncharacterized protein n=2 Tax=Catalinimonas alkaloidigena TaxID=1075417 RepID=A0A1G9N370_9BACT|nr:hypothetical protein SAMN05421823_108166 [Catalinimonas alkaloidigena]
MSFFTILLVIAGVGGLYFYPLEKEFVGSAWAAIFISVYAVNYFIFLFGKRYRIIVSKHGDDIKTWEKRLVLAYIIFSFAMLVLFVAIARKSYNP